MDTLLLGITVVSLIVALVMSVTAWRVTRDEKRRALARIAALSAASTDDAVRKDFPELPIVEQPVQRAAVRTPWKPAPFDSTVSAAAAAEPVLLRNDPPKNGESTLHATGFLGASQIENGNSSRQRGLAIATVVFFITITSGFLYMMSGSDTAPVAAAVSNDAPLELVSLSHARQNNPSTGPRAGKLVVSGLVRNPVAGKTVEKLSAVVFLFDRAGTFVTSSRANVDFLKLGAGDESPFVVSIDAPATVARYRVSFRTDDGVVPHIDRRGESPAPTEGQPLNISAK